MTRIPTLALAALLGAALPATAQEKHTPSTPVTAPEPGPDPAVLKAMKSQVFVIQHCSPGQLFEILGPLSSGNPAARMSWSGLGPGGAISVRDFPENLATIESAIKRLDVVPTRNQAPGVELHLQVLLASKASVAESDLPPELAKILATLRNTLAFRGFTPIASFVQRAKSQEPLMQPVKGSGIVDANLWNPEGGKSSSEVEVSWSAWGLEVPSSASSEIRIQNFKLTVQEHGSQGTHDLASFHTGLNLKEGETVVVGTSVVKGRGLIVVLSAKRVQ